MGASHSMIVRILRGVPVRVRVSIALLFILTCRLPVTVFGVDQAWNDVFISELDSVGKLKSISRTELSQHTTSDDCWIGLHGIVFKVDGETLKNHPGGAGTILKNADCKMQIADCRW